MDDDVNIIIPDRKKEYKQCNKLEIRISIKGISEMHRQPVKFIVSMILLKA